MPNKKDEIENRFTAARHVMDDLCRAYYGMTWDEHERLHGGRGGSGGYLPLFTACLQMAAELAGKEFDPANYTELELWQLCELYAASGLSVQDFAERHLMRALEKAKFENDLKYDIDVANRLGIVPVTYLRRKKKSFQTTPLQDFALMARVLHFTGREVCEIVGVPYKEVTTE